MKLFIPEEKEVIRVDIKGGKNNSACLTVIDTDIYQAKSFIEELLKDVYYHEERICLDAVPKLTISCYEAKGNKKGKSKSLTVYGVKADYVKNLIISKLTKYEDKQRAKKKNKQTYE